MKFISKEEFLKQPKEVQNKIRELWNPQQNDVFTRKGCKGIIPYLILDRDEDMIMTDTCNCEVWYEYLDDRIVPLLTMDKIIDMIINLKNEYINIRYDDEWGKFIIDTPDYMKDGDKLHSLWEILIELIKEKL